MSFEEPTQRVRRPGHAPQGTPDAPTTALPGPLNLAGSDTSAANGTTDVLSLDELFDGDAPPADRSRVDEAPTWTAMPVVPVRSEPVGLPAYGPSGDAAPTPPGGRVLDDAAAAWEAAVRRTRAWLARDDNGLTLATALVAVILIVAIAGLS